MRRLWLSVALALGMVGSGLAQDVSPPLAPATPILTLDKERIFRDSIAGQQVEAYITAENEALAAQNRNIDAALETEERDLTKRRPLLAAEEFQALAEAFNTKAVGLRDAQVSKARALQRKRDEKRQEFFQSLVPVLGEIMQDTGAFVILDDSAVLLSFDRIDITDEAIRRMDARIIPATP
jgi:Skp family chaperone for outer membrane proteins